MLQRPLTLGAAAAAGTILVAAVDPETTDVPLCPLKALTGLDCPLCGSLRAVASLARLDVARAFDHNALFTLAVPFLVAGWAAWLWTSWRARPVPLRAPWASAAALGVLAIFGVVRNLPLFPWLASGV
jgi:hypothetical protein